MMLSIRTDSKMIEEKKYIVDVLFSEFLGLAYELNVNNPTQGIQIELSNGCLIKLCDSFFVHGDNGYLTAAMLPEVISIDCDYAAEGNIPVLYGKGHITTEDRIIDCGIDIFGCCFFMLSRMEEAIVKERDSHERFSALSSSAYKYGFLERPIVDEYTEMLWRMLSALDSRLERRRRKPNMHVTCDVDWPFDINRRSLFSTIRKSMNDIIRNKDIISALKTWKLWAGHRLGFEEADEYRDTINWMMDVNEKVGRKVSFYFITEFTSPIDSNFDFDSQEMRALFRAISSRGHYIGLHPGYRCFDNQQLFERSAKTLKRVLEEEKITQSEIGGRMHLLRWDIKQTPQLWESNGLDYDSTLSFADVSGFRCGTCHEYSMYDLVTRTKMKLKQRPLINMECTVIAQRYEGLGYTDSALKRFNYFKDICTKYNGSYTLLWHNSHFSRNEDRIFYQNLISKD